MGTISGGNDGVRWTRLHTRRGRDRRMTVGSKLVLDHPPGNIRLTKRVHRSRDMTVDADPLAELETCIMAQEEYE
jgi:hypothetical protein